MLCGYQGDSYYNALAESIIGLFKTRVIHKRSPWNTPLWNWQTGSTNAGYQDPSTTYCPTNSSRHTMTDWKSWPEQPDSYGTVSGIPGAIHYPKLRYLSFLVVLPSPGLA